MTYMRTVYVYVFVFMNKIITEDAEGKLFVLFLDIMFKFR